MEVKKILTEYQNNGTKNLVKKPDDNIKTGPVDSKELAQFLIDKVGGAQAFKDLYNNWATKYTDSLKQAANIDYQSYTAKDKMVEAAKSMGALSGAGKLYNYVNTALGGQDISEQLDNDSDYAKSLMDGANYYSQWETAEDYNKYKEEFNKFSASKYAAYTQMNDPFKFRVIKDILDNQKKIRDEEREELFNNSRNKAPDSSFPLQPMSVTGESSVNSPFYQERDGISEGEDISGHADNLLYGITNKISDEEYAWLQEYFNFLQNKAYDEIGYAPFSSVLDMKKRQWEKMATEDPVGASILSLYDNLFGAIPSFVGNTITMLSGEGIDANASWNEPILRSQTIRATIAQNISNADYENWQEKHPNESYEDYSKIAITWGDVGSFAYMTGMSFADSMLAAGFGAMTGGGQVVSLAIMGTAAASNTTLDKISKGYTNEQAFSLGIIAGAAEIITEKFSLDALFDKGSKGLGYVLKNFVVEGTEELGSDIINFAADTLIMCDQSEWSKMVQSHINDGDDKQTAIWKSVLDIAEQWGADFLGGALCGGFAGSINSVFNYGNEKAVGKRIKAAGLTETVAEIGSKSSDSKIAKIGNQLQEYIANGTKISNAKLGSATVEIFNDVISETVNDISAALKRRGYSASQANELGRIITSSITGQSESLSDIRIAMKDAKALNIVKTEVNTDRALELGAVNKVLSLSDVISGLMSDTDISTQIEHNEQSDAVQQSDSGIQQVDDNSQNKFSNLRLLSSNDTIVYEEGDDNGNKNTGILGGESVSTFSGSRDGIRTQSKNTRKMEKILGVSLQSRKTRSPITAGLCGWLEDRNRKSGVGLRRSLQSFVGDLSAKQIKQVDTVGRPLSPELQEKLKDSVFKTEDGTILSLYHWTDAIFNVFAYGDIGFHFGTLEAAEKLWHNKKSSKTGVFKEVYLNIKNPVFINYDPMTWDAFTASYKLYEIGVFTHDDISSLEGLDGYHCGKYDSEASKQLRKMLINKGYDGILYTNEYEGDLSVIAFSAEQIVTVAENGVDKSGLNDSAFSNAEKSSFDEPDLTDTSELDPYERVVRRMNGEQFDRTPQHERVEQTAQKLGRKLYWDCNFGDGYIDSDGNIHLAPNTEDPIFKVFKHDLTHYLEKNERLYNLFANAVMDSQVFKDWVKSKGYNSTAEFVEAKKALYEEAEKERQRTNPEAPQVKCDNPDAEILADFVGEMLFGGKYELTDKLLRAMEKKSRRSFFEAVKDWFAKIKRAMLGTKEIKTIEQAEDAFLRTYKAVQKSVEKGKTGGSVEYSYAGVNSRTADKSLLLKAQSMLDNGADSETVRKETGWFKGYDGKWRFEIDDFDSYLVENPKLEKHTDGNDVYFTGKLSDILNHKELFKAYPQLKDINIIIQTTDFGVEGIYQKNSNYITLSIEQFKRYTKEYHDYLNGDRKAEIERIEQTPEYQEYNKLFDDPTYDEMNPAEWLELETAVREKFYSSELGKRYHELKWGKNGFTGEKFEFGWDKGAKAVLMHEVQHAVQSIEDFASGASTNNSNYDRVAGEIESRDVEKRLNYSAEQRKNTRPDIDRTDVVFADGSTGIILSKDISEYPYNMQTVIKEYMSSVDESIEHFIKTFNSNNRFARHKISNVTENQATDIKRLLGIDVNGFTNDINTNAIRHIEKRHGKNGVADSSMSNISDIARIGYVLKNYDDVEIAKNGLDEVNSAEFRNSKNEPAPMLIFSKKINGTYYVAQAIPDSEYKKLWIVSAYISEKEAGTQALNTKNKSQVGMSLASSASDTTVSQKAQSVNSQYMQEGENNSSDADTNSESGDFSPENGDKVPYSISERSFENNAYTEYDKPITIEDVKTLQSIRRKSVNRFTGEDIKKSQKWAYKFYKELGTKSPFFRAWFGDWRAHDVSPVSIADIPNYVATNEARKTQRGNVVNADTGWDIRISREGETNTISHSGDMRLSEYGLAGIRSLVENAILLDSEVHEHHSKNATDDRIAFDHKLYALGQDIDGNIAVYRITIEEIFQDPYHTNEIRFHNLKYIEKVAEASADANVEQRYKDGSTMRSSTTIYTVSDLYSLVKQYDKEFTSAPEVNPLFLNEDGTPEDGTPKVFYHGAKKNGGFTEFKSWQYFTDNKTYAERYAERGNENSLYEVFLTANKIFDTRDEEAKSIFEKIRQEYGLGELQDTGLPDWTDGYDLSDYLDEHPELGYDAIILDEGGDLVDGKPVSRGESIVIKDSTQIKSATDNIGTFDKSNPDVRYSIPSRTAADLLDQYERGEITKEEYLARITKQRTETPGQIARLTPEDASTTPKAPEVTDDGELTGDSSFYENVREKSKFVNETVKQIITDDRFIKHYAAITNKETLETAAKKLNEGGESFVNKWFTKTPQDMTAEDIAVGLILIERYQTAGDSASAVNVMRKLRQAGTKAGQTVQAFSMLGRLDPTTMQMYMQKELDEAFEEMVKGRTQKWIDENQSKFELTEEEMDYIRRRTLQAANATDKRTKDIAVAEILAMVSNKIPPEKGRALKSLQRVCMLFNLKTQVRNILGNTAMVPAFWASDMVGSVIDRRISNKTGYRTKSARFMSKSKAKAFKRGAAESFEDYRLGIDTRQELDRFDIGQGKSFNDQHTGAASILNPVSKVLNRIDQLDSFLLDLGDRPFFEYWFTNSLENQMRLNDVTEPTAEMMEIAEQEALTRVWQDNNKFTESVKKFKGVLNNIGVEGYGMGDVLIKFVKTPANLTKAMVDFSPIGLMQGLKDTHAFHTALKTGHGNIQLMQYQMVKSLSNGIVGTLMYTAFFALAAGLVKSIKIKGASDDDDDVKDFEKNVLGEYPYTITIGDKSFSYEWMAPIGAMMATSASIVDAVEEGGDLGTVIKNGVRDAAEVLFNQSFMQNIQEVMTNSEGPVVGAAQAILDEPAVLIPQLMSQVASMLDDESRQTYQKNDTWQTLINTIKYKIPGLRETLEPTVDTLGREVENPRGDFFNAFINPANAYSSNPTETSEEVYRLYESTGDAGVIYPKAPSSLEINKVTYTLTIKERNQYQTTLGKTADGNIASLMKLGAYKEMTDAERVDTIKNIYNYARNIAKAEYLNDDSVLTGKERKMKILEEDGIMSAAEYLMLTQEADTDGNGYLTEKELNAALNNYINDKKMRAFVKKLYGAKNDEIDGIAESYNN